MDKHTGRSTRVLSLAILVGLTMGLAVLLGLLDARGVVLGQGIEMPSSVDPLMAYSTALEAVPSMPLTATSSYTYYFPIVTRNYIAPVWMSLGPAGVGVRTIVLAPQVPSTIYVGTTDGIYKSTDAGQRWEALNDWGRSILVIDPISPTNLYLGGAAWVYRSTNGGESWEKCGEYLSLPTIALAIDHLNPDTLYVSRGQFELFGGEMYKSEGLCNGWREILPKFTYARSIVIDPVNSNVIYILGGDNEVRKSTDGGESWDVITTGLDIMYVRCLVVSPHDHETLYAGTNEGIFRSTNGGGSWFRVSNGLSAQDVRLLTIDANTPETMYAGAHPSNECDSVYKSTDAGDSWLSIGLTGQCVHALAVHPFNSQIIYVGTDDGVWRYGPPSDGL